MKEETEKKEGQEKAMRDFQQTLDQINAEEEDQCARHETIVTGNTEIVDIEDEGPKSRCEEPPISGRRSINKRKVNFNNLCGDSNSVIEILRRFKFKYSISDVNN